jgi:hypothetical protein
MAAQISSNDSKFPRKNWYPVVPELSMPSEAMLDQNRLSRLPRVCEVIADIMRSLSVSVDDVGSTFRIAM